MVFVILERILKQGIIWALFKTQGRRYAHYLYVLRFDYKDVLL